MKREILFRGKDKVTKKWVYGDYTHNEGLNTHYISRNVNNTSRKAWEVDPDIVGQYTGLKDKNGNKIFEGDIVTIGNNLKAVVIWFNGSFRFKDELSSKATYFDDIGIIMRDYDVQVVSNIHDNPNYQASV